MEEKLDIKLLKTLGALTRKIRKEVSLMPKVGLDIREIINFVENKIFENGYMPAFPCTVSVNDIAAHYTVFDDSYLLKKGDLIKIDFGITHEGMITDNATTIEVEDNKYEKLVKASFEGMNASVDAIRLGNSMGEVGAKSEEVAKKYGFNVIKNLSGHQIGKNNLHCGLSVPSYDNGDDSLIEDNCEFAIEPFFTLGSPKIKSAGPSNILHLVNDKPVRDAIAKKVLIYIRENFGILPFSRRWLLDDISTEIPAFSKAKGFNKNRVLYGLKILMAHNIVYEYDALKTVDGAMVSQFEDAVVFVDGERTVITRLYDEDLLEE